MFKKVLIANRGEIAIRIMATCREMGIQTVAVYSEADRHAHHVREADEAYYIGPAPAPQSYLRIPTIIEVARQTVAEAIHPGYGFLSENAAFVEACEQAGIVFIGPPAPAMRLMGSKIAAKQLAQSVGAPTIPGYNGENQEDAVRIAKAAAYVNAGTLEFMLDTDRRFYFLEMNTRLQVEHPVTELVTGIDLVRHQLRIASGDPLELAQEQISQRGHAIEVRLYAEDPQQNFLPSTGSVTTFLKPAGPGIRVDSGIASGDEITQYYDPMIAKVIVYGEDRPAAIARLQAALEQQAVFGVTTNAPLLHAIAVHPAFREGRTYTNFLDEYGLIGEVTEQQSEGVQPDTYALFAAACYDLLRQAAPGSSNNGAVFSNNPWQTLGPWRMIGESRSISYSYHGQPYQAALSPSPRDSGLWKIQLQGDHGKPAAHIGCVFGADGLVLLQEEARQVRAFAQRLNNETQVIIHGQMYRFERRQPPDVDATAHGGNPASAQKTLTAPMAGTIVKVQVQDGQTVQHRQVLVILSAVKMEHTIVAPYEGKVRRVHYAEGAVVKGGAVLVEME